MGYFPNNRFHIDAATPNKGRRWAVARSEAKWRVATTACRMLASAITACLCVGIASKAVAAKESLATTVQKAFAATHDGWSSDEVLVNDDLNSAFLAKCRELKLVDTDEKLNWTMLNLRKAGKLNVPVTKRRRDNHDEYRHAAEIASRLLCDRHQLNVDRILCHTDHRREFDQITNKIAPGVEPYLLRKAALGLRKARRLRPELVVRIADWGRQVITLNASEIVADASIVPTNPGIYLFRDKTGYLYIGESKNLRTRIENHLDESDRKSLANYLKANQAELATTTVELHSFDPDSKAAKTSVRRAYESELIHSRKPRFNVRP